MGVRRDIEGLRALSVIGVLAFHAGMPFATGGYVGVDVFFVISGFLITGLLLRDSERERSTSTSTMLVEFYARRARRILPAAAVVLVATLVGSAIIHNGVENVRAVDDARAVVLFFANHEFANADGYFNESNRSMFQQYWSLSVEEQFYALWPLLFFGLALIAGRRRQRVVIGSALGIGCVASLALSTAWASNTTWLSKDPWYAFYLLPSRGWQLGLGALLAVAGRPLARLLTLRAQRTTAAAGLIAIAAAMTLFDSSTGVPGWPALLPTLGAAAVILAGIERATGGPTDAALGSPLAQTVGRHSFSLYLWHWPVLLLAQAALPDVGRARIVHGTIMLAVSVPAAMLTYRFVENPVRHARPLRLRPTWSLGFGAVVMAVSLLAVSVLDGLSRDSLRTDMIADAAPVAAGQVAPTDFVPDNLVPPLTEAIRTRFHLRRACGDPCVVGATSNPAHDVVLLGDSHAEHLAPAIEQAFRGDSVRLTSHLLRGCSLFAPRFSVAGDVCPNFVEATLTSLRATPPDLIILSSRTERTHRRNTSATERGVGQLMTRLPPESRVIVVGETPFAPRDVKLCLAENLYRAYECDQRWPTKHNERIRPLVEAHGAAFLDLRPVLCTPQRCPAISGNHLIWSDRDHLTVEYSRTLGPWMRTQLEPLLSPQAGGTPSMVAGAATTQQPTPTTPPATPAETADVPTAIATSPTTLATSTSPFGTTLRSPSDVPSVDQTKRGP